MKTSNQLKQERASLVKQQGALLDLRKTEKRDFSEDETKTFNTLNASIKTLDTSITQREAEEAAELRSAELEGAPVEKPSETKQPERYSLHKALRSQMRNGEALSGIELEVHNLITEQARTAGVKLNGIAVPISALMNEARADAQTVTQDAGAYGANLVNTQHRGVIDFLRPKPVLESLGATYLTGLSGNIEFATNDGGITATWEGEIATVAVTKNAYGKKTMTPKRLSVTVPISLQNILQSSIDLEAYTVKDINSILANAIDAAGINGAGTGSIPEGILNTTGINVVAMGTDGAAPTWASVVDMETGVEVANANGAKMAYLINPATKGKFKKTKHTAGDLNYLMSVNNEINGYPVGVTTLVPADLTKGTGDPLSAAIFGDFSQLLIGQWGFVDIVVDEITRKKEGLIEITVNSFIDLLVKQATAFSVVKDYDLAL